MSVLIDLVTPDNPTFSVTVQRATDQIDCSYSMSFLDNTVTSNPNLQGKSKYYRLDLTNNTEIFLGEAAPGQIIVFNFEKEGSYQIKQVFEICQQGEPDTIIYREEDVFLINILEYKPIFEFQNKVSPECSEVDQQITVIPSFIQHNNDVCGPIDIDGGYSGAHYSENYAIFASQFQTLSYQVYKFNQESAQYEAFGIPVEYSVTSEIPTDYQLTFIPDEVSLYKVEAILTNCCKTVKREIIYEVCNPVVIESSCENVEDCENCFSYSINNYSTEAITVVVRDLITNLDIASIDVPAEGTRSFMFPQDSVYGLSWELAGVENNAVLNIMCDINQCYSGLLRTQLCIDGNNPDSGCCDQDDVFIGSRLANIQALYQTYLNLIEPYTSLDIRYSNIDITNMLDKFLRVGVIRDQLLKFCEGCIQDRFGCLDCKKGLYEK